MPDPSVVASYLDVLRDVLDRIRTTQGDGIEAAAQACADAIAADGLVHAFGAGHSRVVVEELWPRYGSYPGFHPIVELSITHWHQVVGANGQRQAMFLENVPGFAAQVLRNFVAQPPDAFIAISSGGTGVATVEMAEGMQARGVTVIAITSVEQSRQSAAKAPSGNRLCDVADIVLDTCTPVGDAAIPFAETAGAVGPTTTVAAAAIANAIKVRTAELLIARGVVPKVLPAGVVVGAEAMARAFDEAYDEHGRRLGILYSRPYPPRTEP